MGDLECPHLFADSSYKVLSPNANDFTGKVASILARRMHTSLSDTSFTFNAFNRDADYRLPILRRALLDGSAWEPSTADILQSYCAVVSKKTPKQKGLGAKRVKDLEQLQSAGTTLDQEEATAYRALAARANYLALDRPDVAVATKELCREFSAPTVHSFQKLKRLVRYLQHHPRLAWR